MTESCDLVGLLSIAAQAAMALIIVGAMLGIDGWRSQETPWESTPQVASLPARHLQTVHLDGRCAYGQPEVVASLLGPGWRPVPSVSLPDLDT